MGCIISLFRHGTFWPHVATADLKQKSGDETSGKYVHKQSISSTSEGQAATKIQAGFRGYKARKEMKLMNQKSTDQISMKANMKSPPLATIKEEEEAATKIQAGVRGFLTRKKMKQSFDLGMSQSIDIVEGAEVDAAQVIVQEVIDAAEKADIQNQGQLSAVSEPKPSEDTEPLQADEPKILPAKKVETETEDISDSKKDTSEPSKETGGENASEVVPDEDTIVIEPEIVQRRMHEELQSFPPKHESPETGNTVQEPEVEEGEQQTDEADAAAEEELKTPNNSLEEELELQVEPEVKLQLEPEAKQQVEPEVKQQIEPEVKQQIEREVTQVEPEVKQQVEPEAKQQFIADSAASPAEQPSPSALVQKSPENLKRSLNQTESFVSEIEIQINEDKPHEQKTETEVESIVPETLVPETDGEVQPTEKTTPETEINAAENKLPTKEDEIKEPNEPSTVEVEPKSVEPEANKEEKSLETDQSTTAIQAENLETDTPALQTAVLEINTSATEKSELASETETNTAKTENTASVVQAETLPTEDTAEATALETAIPLNTTTISENQKTEPEEVPTDADTTSPTTHETVATKVVLQENMADAPETQKDEVPHREIQNENAEPDNDSEPNISVSEEGEDEVKHVVSLGTVPEEEDAGSVPTSPEPITALELNKSPTNAQDISTQEIDAEAVTATAAKTDVPEGKEVITKSEAEVPAKIVSSDVSAVSSDRSEAEVKAEEVKSPLEISTPEPPTEDVPVQRRSSKRKTGSGAEKYRSGVVVDSLYLPEPSANTHEMQKLDELDAEIESDAALLNNAASKIQAGYRGYQVRKSMNNDDNGRS